MPAPFPPLFGTRLVRNMALYILGEHRVTLVGGGHFVAPDAAVIGRVTLGDSANVWFNVVIRGDRDDIRIGEGTNIQDGSVLHADPGFPLTLGRQVTIGHKVMLHGCTVGDGSLIGMNAVVMNGATIGEESILGASSLVAEGKVIPAGVLAMGAPARVIRELKPEERVAGRRTAEGYVRRARQYLEGLKSQG